MTTLNWKDLLLGREAMRALPKDQLNQLSSVAGGYVHSLAHGVSGIGNLLACTASNSETGLSADAAANIGWMLESIGSLISNLSDTVEEADHQISKMK